MAEDRERDVQKSTSAWEIRGDELLGDLGATMNHDTGQ